MTNQTAPTPTEIVEQIAEARERGVAPTVARRIAAALVAAKKVTLVKDPESKFGVDYDVFYGGAKIGRVGRFESERTFTGRCTSAYSGNYRTHPGVGLTAGETKGWEDATRTTAVENVIAGAILNTDGTFDPQVVVAKKSLSANRQKADEVRKVGAEFAAKINALAESDRELASEVLAAILDQITD